MDTLPSCSSCLSNTEAESDPSFTLYRKRWMGPRFCVAAFGGVADSTGPLPFVSLGGSVTDSGFVEAGVSSSAAFFFAIFPSFVEVHHASREPRQQVPILHRFCECGLIATLAIGLR